jgi:hypothetical protein
MQKRKHYNFYRILGREGLRIQYTIYKRVKILREEFKLKLKI